MSQPSTTSTTQSVQFPDWFSAAATANTLPFMQPQKNMTAGLTEDQLRAGNLARQGARTAYSGNDYASRIADAGQGYQAAKVTGQDAVELMNPYLDSVGRDTLNALRREHGNTAAEIGARTASGVAFGGSGGAIERAQLNRSHGEQVGSTISNLLSSGYDRGAQLASENAQMENNARQFNSSQNLAALLGANTAANDTQSRQRYAMQDLLGYGNMVQGQAQRVLDQPYTAMQRYAGLMPGAQVNTQPNNSPGFLQQLLGVGLSVAGMPITGGGSLAGNFLGGLGR